jgi:UDP-glucuronate 4-epimerase
VKIVVTGAAGFIGMHLCENLIERGHEITCAVDSLKPAYGTNLSNLRSERLKKSGIKITQIDIAKISNEELVKKISGAEVIVHLAAYAGVRQSAVTPDKYSTSNLTGFANILEAVRIVKPTIFLFASSSSVYGETNSTDFQLEESANGLNLVSYYAATKWVNEVLARSHAKNYKINSVAMRFFTVYGTYGRPDMSYMAFFEKILNDDQIELFGQNGGQRSFSYVLDVVNIIGSLIESEALISKLNNSTTHFEALNIGNSKTDTASNLIKILEHESQKKARIKIIERPSFDVSSTSASMIKTFSYLSHKQEFTNLTDGIEEFTQWYLNDFLRPQK